MLDNLIHDYKYLGLFSIKCSDGSLVTLSEEVEVLEWSEKLSPQLEGGLLHFHLFNVWPSL